MGTTDSEYISLADDGLSEIGQLVGSSGETLEIEVSGTGGHDFEIGSGGEVRLQPQGTEALVAETDSDVSIPNGDLNMSGNHLLNVDDVWFNGGGNNLSAFYLPNTSNAQLGVYDNDGTGYLMRWRDSGRIEIGANAELDLNGKALKNVNALEAAGSTSVFDLTGSAASDTLQIRDGSNNPITTFKGDGSVEVPNGNLDMNSNNITNCWLINGANCSLLAEITKENSSTAAITSSQGEWNTGVFNGTSADRKDNSGVLGIGYRDGTASDNLIGFYRFDKTAGAVMDYSGDGNDGTNNGETRGAAGVLGTGAYDFDPSANSVEVSGFGWSDSNFTVTMWIHPDSWRGSGQNTFVFIGDDLADKEVLFAQKNGGIIQEYYNGTTTHGLTGGTRPATGEWSHVAMTFDAVTGNWSYYLNGGLDSSVVDDVSVATGTGPDNMIGDDPASLSRGFDGRIDEVRVYDQVLSATAIMDLYFNNVSGSGYMGNYTKTITAGNTADWRNVTVNASIPLQTSVDMVFQTLNEGGAVVDEQVIDLLGGENTYSLSVPDSQDARWSFNGTSTNASRTWEVDDVSVMYYANAVYVGNQTLAQVLANGNSAGQHDIDMDGNDLNNVGTLNANTKNFVQQVNSTHEVVYTSQESAAVRAVIEGTATVADGKTRIDIPVHFTQVVSDTNPRITVQLTPQGYLDGQLGYLTKTDEYIVIAGPPNRTVQFDYRITGIRDGFEDKQVIRQLN